MALVKREGVLLGQILSVEDVDEDVGVVVSKVGPE